MHSVIKYISVFLILIAMALWSCDNTVDINDDYKEITIVYGLLDHSETTHYIKITKAFLSETNIYLAAQDPANSQYPAEDIEVWLEEWDENGVFRQTIYLDTTLITNKDEGDFYFPSQILYKTADNTILNNFYTYKLFIKNKVSGKLIDSETTLIGNTRLMKPGENTKSLSLTGLYPNDLKWVNGENGLIYDISFRFFYTEIYQGDTTSKYIDWEQAQVRGTSTSGVATLNSSYFGPSYYNFLQNAIDLPLAGMKRFSDSVHLVLYGGNEDLAIYMDVNAPSTSIVQERPQYTNITNGMGIFASRYRYVKSFSALANRSLDTLYYGQYTKHLGFVPRPLK